MLKLSGLPNANAKSQRFSYSISQIAPLPPVVAYAAPIGAFFCPEILAFTGAFFNRFQSP